MKKVDLSTEYDKYLAYLNSQKWAELRNKALERDEYHCSICGNPNNLEVHHLKYPDTLGTEPLSDLMTLCRDCHKRLEEYKKGHEKSQYMHTWRPPKEKKWILWLKFENEQLYESIKKEIGDKFISYEYDERASSFVRVLISDMPRYRDIGCQDFTHNQIKDLKDFIDQNHKSICETKIVKVEEF